MKSGAEPMQNARRRTDCELAQAAAGGDMAAKRRLVERLMPSIRTTLHYLAPGDRDADDLVQAALIEILRASGSFRGESRLSLWACRIAVRTAMHYLKRRTARHGTAPDKDAPEPVETETPEDRWETLRMRRHIRGVLERLPLEQRTALVLRLVHGMSVEETADVMRCPLNTARERLRIARKRFQRYLTRDAVLREWAQRRES